MKKSVKSELISVSGGFTFLEVIIYLALATMIVGLLFSYGWNMMFIRVKFDTISESLSGTRSVSDRLQETIRSAQDIDNTRSSFNSVPGKLVLNTADELVKIESVDDKISITRGDAPAQFLHSDNVRIRNFKLTKQEDSDGKIHYIGFSFTTESFYPLSGNRAEYQYLIPYQSGAAVRKQ